MNKPPVAKLAGPLKSVQAGDEVIFDGSGSVDPDGTIANWEVDFDDGTPHADGDGPPPSSIPHRYEFEGEYSVTLMVWESGKGRRKGHSASVMVSVREPKDALLSEFVLSTPGPWGPCVEGPTGFQHTRQETWTRTILEPAELGGWSPAAEDLIETRVGVEDCVLEPVHCVLSDWAVVRESLWSACADGKQSKTIEYAKTILVHPENGGTACEGPFTRTETVERECVVTQGFHSVFDKWSVSPTVVRAHSLRDQSQLNNLVCATTTGVCTKNIDWSDDPAVNMGKLTFNPSRSNPLRIALTQAEMTRTQNGSSLIHWRTRLDPNLDQTFASQLGKVFQITTPEASAMRYIEFRFVPEFDGIKGSINLYNDGLPYLSYGPGATGWTGVRGANTAFGDALQPQKAEMRVKRGVLTSFIAYFEHTKEVFEGVANGRPFDRFSLWTYDEDRGLVHVYDRLAILQRAAILGFWFQFQQGGNGVVPVGTHYAWNDDFLLLENAPIDEFLNDVVNQVSA